MRKIRMMLYMKGYRDGIKQNYQSLLIRFRFYRLGWQSGNDEYHDREWWNARKEEEENV